METQTTEVEAVHGLPFEVLPERAQEFAFADTETHSGKSDVAENPEDQDDGEENLPGVDVELVQFVPVQTDENVVGNCVEEATTDSVI